LKTLTEKTLTLENLRERIMRVKQKLAEAAARSNVRLPEIVFVTKSVDAETIARLAELENKVVVGENKVQDGLKKIKWIKENRPDLVNKINWHFIGRLQKNKVKKVVDAFDCIQSIDSLELARKASKTAQAIGKTIPVFVEVNVSGEANKAGITIHQASAITQEIMALPNLKVEGLMTIAPFVEPEKTRPFFKKLKSLANSLGLKTSMGMSNDFEIAIEEGSNMVRIGRIVFEPERL